MSLPWAGKTGLAKLATIFATGFVVSLGLCGINFIAATSGAFRGAGGSTLMIVSAYAELAGMAGCGIGLLFVGLMALSDAVARRFGGHKNPPED